MSSSVALSIPRLADRFFGLVLVGAAVLVIEGVRLAGPDIPNPAAILMVAVVYAAYRGGLAPGLVGAGMAWLYLAYFWSMPDQFLQFTAPNLVRIVLWALATPALALLVGLLQRRAERAREAAARGAALQAQWEERERAAAAVRASQARFESLFESSPDAIVAVDAAGRIVQANQRVETLFGYRREALIGQPVEMLMPDRFRDRHVGHREGYLAEPAIRPMGPGLALYGRRQDGEEFPIEVALGPLQSNGQAGMLATIRDITQRRRAEAAVQAKNEEIRAISQQLWQAAKLATMGELTASIAHELNNPLATVTLRVEGLLARLPSDDPRRGALETIEQECDRMAGLVANLLQTSRRGEPQISSVDVRDEIEKTLELVMPQLRQRTIAVAREYAPDAPLVRGDRQQLRQLLLNLIANASDAMLAGGTLTLRVKAWTPERLAIEIADTGTGIAPEHLAKVLEPFFTTKADGRGTGLGLAICRRIVHEHQGSLDITSDGVPGRGTTARVILPITSGQNVAQLSA